MTPFSNFASERAAAELYFAKLIKFSRTQPNGATNNSALGKSWPPSSQDGLYCISNTISNTRCRTYCIHERMAKGSEFEIQVRLALPLGWSIRGPPLVRFCTQLGLAGGQDTNSRRSNEDY